MARREKQETFTLRLPSRLTKELAKVKEKTDLSRNFIITMIIHDYFEDLAATKKEAA